MSITTYKAAAVASRTYHRTEAIPSSEYGKILQDSDGDLFVIVEGESSFGVPARVMSSHLDTDCCISWPISPAPAGTSITITND